MVLPLPAGTASLKAMYEDFTALDRWTGNPLHCVWRGTLVAIATPIPNMVATVFRERISPELRERLRKQTA